MKHVLSIHHQADEETITHLVSMETEDILRFEVPVSHSVVMEKGESCGHLASHLCCLSLHKSLSPLDLGQQMT